MSDLQQPIGSGFGRATTTHEVLTGIDLSGQLALVTGGYSGIGLAATQAFLNAGARVIVPARRPEIAEQALAGAGDVEVEALDLADQASVAAFAERFLASGRSLDIVVASAGIMATPLKRVGPGWEWQFATNHLGHFALVNRLWPALAAEGGARVVMVSSSAHRVAGVRWDDVQCTSGEYDKWAAYGQSKTANALFALHLDRLGAGAGVRAFSVHPGVTGTDLQRHIPIAEQVAMGWANEDGTPAHPEMMKSPEQGAATGVWAATSPMLEGAGGAYLEDCEVAQVTDDGRDFSQPGVAPHAVDADQATRLWRTSAELTAVDAFGGN